MKTENPTEARKGTSRSRLLPALAGTALCLSLASCVYPYDDGRYGSTSTITTHQPGYRLDSLPSGYRSENLGGSTYYYHNGAYYQRHSGGYVVAEAPRRSRYYEEYSRSR